RDVPRDLLQHGRRPLAPAVGQAVRHEGALGEPGGRQRSQPAHAQGLPDVRDEPLLAGLDEPVVPGRLRLLLDAHELRLEDRHQRAQRFTVFDVAVAQDRRQELIEPFVASHASISEISMPSGSTSNSSAGVTSPPVQLGRAALSTADKLSASPDKKSASMSAAMTPSTVCTVAASSETETACPKSRVEKPYAAINPWRTASSTSDRR